MNSILFLTYLYMYYTMNVMQTVIYRVAPQKTEQWIWSIFQDFALINCYFFTLLDGASSSHIYTKIIKFSWELFILWVIPYGLSFSGFARFPEFRGTINDSFSSTCANTYQHSTSYKEISVPMTCLDCKSLLGNTRITEHNTRSIYGRPKLSLIVPRNSWNRANPKNDSPYEITNNFITLKKKFNQIWRS